MSEETNLPNMNTKNGNFICGVVEGFYGRPWTSEQRKDLFEKLKKWGMNSYVYAPKDDSKHRANWRDLYTVEEAEHLTSLISSACEHGITFYYALSPGLDITYSSSKEVVALRRKLEQVAQFGCSAFALLFDDIEPEMSEADKEVFQSFAHAQVSVTNDIYQHLNQPKFLICPTQYCATRAVPNVQNSEYLSTLGSKLAPDIDIMWTGSKVISRTLTVSDVEEVSQVLRRPPLIWDNLHANDYDQKRVFLGPYQGRPPDLIPRLRGVLTNPNCEFWANFIAINTLAQWSRCTADAAPNESVSSDIKLETESEDGVELTARLPVNLYHARRALMNAIQEWLPEFSKTKQASGFIVKPQVVAVVPPTVIAPVATPLVTTCIALTATSSTPPACTISSQLTTLAQLCTTVNGNTGPVVMNSLLSDTKVCTELMDCNATPPPESSKSSPTEGVETEEEFPKGESPPTSESLSGNKMLVDSNSPEPSDQSNSETMGEWGGGGVAFSVSDLTLLCDLFYLPFEHGSQGVLLLHEFHWLHTHAHLLAQSNHNCEVEEWQNRAKKLAETSQSLDQLFYKLNSINNKELMYELYPYVWEIRAVVSTLNSYINWLGQGKLAKPSDNPYTGNYSWFSKGWKESFMSGDQEPWVFRGGLTADLQRLLPIEGGSDLFVYKVPQVTSSVIYTVRGATEESDPGRIEEVSRAVSVSPACAQQHHARVVSCLLKEKPDLCFVVEEEDTAASMDSKSIVGYSIAFASAKNIPVKLDQEDEMLVRLIEGASDLYPSLVTCGILSSVSDQSVVKRLMLCTLAALRVNGSCGVYTWEKEGSLLEWWSRLGFLELGRSSFGVHLGRTL